MSSKNRLKLTKAEHRAFRKKKHQRDPSVQVLPVSEEEPSVQSVEKQRMVATVLLVEQNSDISQSGENNEINESQNEAKAEPSLGESSQLARVLREAWERCSGFCREQDWPMREFRIRKRFLAYL